MIAPQPANTSAKVPIASAASARGSGGDFTPPPAATGLQTMQQKTGLALPDRLAAPRGCGRLDDGKSLALRLARLHRFHDRAVHPDCDRVRARDRDLLDAGRLQPRLVLPSINRPPTAADLR